MGQNIEEIDHIYIYMYVCEDGGLGAQHVSHGRTHTLSILTRDPLLSTYSSDYYLV